MKARRISILILIAASIGLLIPGLFAPVLTIQGVLKPEGLAHVAPMLLEKGLDTNTVKVLRAMMNPEIIGLLEDSGGDLRATIIKRLGPQIATCSPGSMVRVQSRSTQGSPSA